MSERKRNAVYDEQMLSERLQPVDEAVASVLRTMGDEWVDEWIKDPNVARLSVEPISYKSVPCPKGADPIAHEWLVRWRNSALIVRLDERKRLVERSVALRLKSIIDAHENR